MRIGSGQPGLKPGTPLARIFWPSAQLVINGSEVRLIGADDRHVEVVRHLLTGDVPATAPPPPVDVRHDTAEYRGSRRRRGR